MLALCRTYHVEDISLLFIASITLFTFLIAALYVVVVFVEEENPEVIS